MCLIDDFFCLLYLIKFFINGKGRDDNEVKYSYLFCFDIGIKNGINKVLISELFFLKEIVYEGYYFVNVVLLFFLIFLFIIVKVRIFRVYMQIFIIFINFYV